MKISVAETYEEMSRQVASNVVQLMQSAVHPLLCPASGDSPAGLYQQLVNMVHNGALDISHWNFVGLDEWVGMNGNDQGSCRYYLDRQLFQPLQVPQKQVCLFDGRANNLNVECNRVEDFIHQHGGIEIAVLGLGMNGHVGMNEPGTPAAMRTHVATLDATTQKVGQKYFTEQQQLTQGITLGLQTLMEARHLILLVSGAHKATIVRRVLQEESSEQLPASLLRNHPQLHVYLDKEAAAQL